MARLSKEEQIEKALAAASAFMGREIELPVETKDDLIREAQSVINYFECKGEGFTEKICKTCKLQFKYSHPTGGISYCSIDCARVALKEIGLDWDPSRPIHLRWGRFVPAVIPPKALILVDDILEALLVDTEI